MIFFEFFSFMTLPCPPTGGHGRSGKLLQLISGRSRLEVRTWGNRCKDIREPQIVTFNYPPAGGQLKRHEKIEEERIFPGFYDAESPQGTSISEFIRRTKDAAMTTD